ncbi:MAG: hypothetical protein AAF998_28270 [Bacteroidota bacterium]
MQNDAQDDAPKKGFLESIAPGVFHQAEKEAAGLLPLIHLLDIEFAWEGSDCSNSAIPIQTSATKWEPEYRQMVAYSILDTEEAIREGKLTVRARFQCSDPNLRIQVRAYPVDHDPMDTIKQEISNRYAGRDALGEILPTTVFIDAGGMSAYRRRHAAIPFKLSNPQFPNYGIGVYDVNLRWEYRMEDKTVEAPRGEIAWQEAWYTIKTTLDNLPLHQIEHFQMSRHRVCATMSYPKLPWTPDEFADYWDGPPYPMPLWSFGLEMACNLAAGAQNDIEAGTMIADKIGFMGGFVYHPNPYYTSTKYSKVSRQSGRSREVEEDPNLVYFRFNRFVERILGFGGLGEKVNCLDLAVAVATFANMIGCNMRVGKLQAKPDIDSSDSTHFEDNKFQLGAPILPLGHPPGARIPGVTDKEGAFFGYHAVAYLPYEGDYEDPEQFRDPAGFIFDASVRYLHPDYDTPQSVSGFQLGDGRTPNTYIDFLAADTPMGRPRCIPQPITVVNVQVLY